MNAVVKFVLTCSCGWTHEASSRKSATMWKQWHREQYKPHGGRVSESGHDVSIVKETTLV